MQSGELIKKTILLDFNCSNEYTHHWSSLVAYAAFLRRYQMPTEVWLPRNTSSVIVSRIPSGIKVRKTLKSSQYSRVAISSDPLGFIAEKLVRCFTLINRQIILEVFRRRLIRMYILPAFNELKKEISRHEITIIFPTLDFMGLQLIKLLLNKYPTLQICVRRMGSEEKHPLASGGEFDSLLKLVESKQFINLKLGIPTEQLFQKIRQTSDYPERVFWSPLPPDERFNNALELTNSGPVNIGFPGTVKERKGYDRIAEIATHLINEGLDFKIYVQTALFPWDSYHSSRKNLINAAGSRLVELDPVIDVFSYEELFAKYDLIILPYDKESYANADSGVLYEATDFGIPVACFDDLGFSSEAFKYGIGINLEKVRSFKILFQEIKSETMRSKIRSYNGLRELAIVEFLNLSSKN